MKLVALAALLGSTYSQQRTCEYTGGPHGMYTLNLTSISGWHMEYQGTDNFYYYTPCMNGEICNQGNAQFHGNAVQYGGGNTCKHYLSVDHHDRPQYFFGGASWAFHYSDGEICDVTQQPRELDVWMQCDENLSSGARFYDASEPDTCRYYFIIRTPLACVPENSHNANCQWRYYDFNANETYYLDLSSQNDTIIRGGVSDNGYEMFYSPCQNALHCYQQSNQIQMMSIVENEVTRTCEHYLAEWQEGRVQPFFHDTDPTQVHWSFHYWLSEKCTDGSQGEQTIRWYCDMNAVNTTVINATYDGNCRWEMNLKSMHACPTSEEYQSFNGLKLHKLQY